MEGIYIPGVRIVDNLCVGNEPECFPVEGKIVAYPNGEVWIDILIADAQKEVHRIIPIKDCGRLIDDDSFREKMHHESFETDTPIQKWDGGWIRYKMFEQNIEAAPIIIPAEKMFEQNIEAAPTVISAEKEEYK